MLAAHEGNPEAAAVGGSVENGATTHTLDWASFFVVQAGIAAPIASGPSAKLAGAVNVSYKRSAMGQIDDFDGLGMLDVIHQRGLRQAGQILIADDSIRVWHDQSLGIRGTTAIHYHAGRTSRRVPAPTDGQDGVAASPGRPGRALCPVRPRDLACAAEGLRSRAADRLAGHPMALPGAGRRPGQTPMRSFD